MEQLVILLVIGAIALIKWVIEKSSEQRTKRETDSRIEELEQRNPSVEPHKPPYIDPFPRPRDTVERKFREALGLPEDATLPPPREQMSQPRQPVPPPPIPPQFPRVEPLIVAAADLERRMMRPPLVPKHALQKPARKEEPVPAARATALDELLRSRDGLRSAIVAQEILGTPKGLVF